MKKLFFPLIALLVIFQSCGSSKKKAFDLNQKFSGISTSLNSKGVAIGTELKSAMTTNDFSKVESMSTDLSKYVDEQITNIKNTENVAGSEKFKDAMLSFLGFEKEMVTEAIIPFGKLNTGSTDEEKQAAIDNFIAESKEEQSYLTKLQEEQKDYASRNGFKIEQKNPTY